MQENKGYLFKFPNTIGHFIVNNRQAVEEVQILLEDMDLQLSEKWAYDPHYIISKRRVENSYAPFIHEAKLEIEKLANGGQSTSLGDMEIENPHRSEKILKRGSEDVIDLEEETERSSKKTNLSKGGISSSF